MFLKLVLNSMHKYMVCVTMVRLSGDGTPSKDSKDSKNSVDFLFPLISFMAVTAYHSEHITLMKIAHNPFAKGFRENMYVYHR